MLEGQVEIDKRVKMNKTVSKRETMGLDAHA